MKLKLAAAGAAIIAILAFWHMASRKSATLEKAEQKSLVAEKKEKHKELAKPAQHDGMTLVTQAQIDAKRKRKRSPVTGEVSQDRLQEQKKHADEMHRAGRMEEALQGYLWCYRNAPLWGGRPDRGFLMHIIAGMGRNYPPARGALMQLRDEAQQAIATNPNDRFSIIQLAALNDYLGDKDRNLQAFNASPPGSPGRQVFGLRVLDDLVRDQRYADAVEVQSTQLILDAIENWEQRREKFPQISDQTKMLTMFGKHMEVLAGAGKIEDARRVANKLLEYDNSTAMRDLLTAHATRAGHPEVLVPSPPQ